MSRAVIRDSIAVPIAPVVGAAIKLAQGGLAYVYAEGTTTPISTALMFTGKSGGAVHTNPIVLDAAGTFEAWFDAPKRYTVKITYAGMTDLTRDMDTQSDPADVIHASGTEIRGAGLTLTSPTINTPSMTGGSWASASLTNPSFTGGSWANASISTMTADGNATFSGPFRADGQAIFTGRIALGQPTISPTYMVTQYGDTASGLAPSQIMYAVGQTNREPTVLGTNVESGSIQAYYLERGDSQAQVINANAVAYWNAVMKGNADAGNTFSKRFHPYESNQTLQVGVMSYVQASGPQAGTTRYGPGNVYVKAHFSATTQANPWVNDAAFILTPPGSGNFTLTVSGHGTTGNIAFNASASTIETTLEGLSGMTAANVEVWNYLSGTKMVVIRDLGQSSTLLSAAGATVVHHGNGDAATCVLYAGGTESTEYFMWDDPGDGGPPRLVFWSKDPQSLAASASRNKGHLGIGGVSQPSYPIHVKSLYRSGTYDATAAAGKNLPMMAIQQIQDAVTPVHLILADAADVDEYLALGYNTASNYGVLQALDNGTPVPIVFQPGGGKVGVGTASVTARLQILPLAGEIGLIVQGNTSQSANLEEWWNIGGTKLGQVDKDAKAAFPMLTAGQTTNGASGALFVKQLSAGIAGGVVVAEFGANGHTGNFYQDANDFYFQFVGAGTRYFQFKGATDEIFTPSTLTSNTHLQTHGDVLVAGTKVIGARGAAVADATGAGDVVAQLNALLARLRSTTGHGLIT